MKHLAPLTLLLVCSARCPADDPVSPPPEPARATPGAPARARTPLTALVIDRSLSARAGTIGSIADGSLTMTDATGARVSEPIADLAAVIITGSLVRDSQGVGASAPGSASDPAAVERILRRLRSGSLGVLETVDGQRFPGHFANTSGEQDSIVWTHPSFGTLVFPLDEVAAAFRDMESARVMPEASTPPLDDVLVLTNGDRLRGFIVGLGDPVQIEVDNQPVMIAADRVSAAILSNPRRSRSGDMVWLEDGTAALVGRFALTEGGVVTVALPSGASAEYESSALRALAFGVERFVALSSLTPTLQGPVGDRRVAQPIMTAPNQDDLLASSSPALGAFDVILPGPMRLEYELPARAERLAMTAMLGADAGAWGDCELVVSVDGREVARARLHQAEPTHAINIEARGRTLTIVLEPGRYGPIKDSAVLARPIILLSDDGRAAD